MSTFNLSPQSIVPKSGFYYCTMCKEGDAAIRDALRMHVKDIDPRILEGMFVAAGIGSSEPITRKVFKAGERFGECHKHKTATGWTLETETSSPIENFPKIEGINRKIEMMECPPFLGKSYCSDNECSCFNTAMPPAKGYLWIQYEVAEFRKNCLSLAALEGYMAAERITTIDEMRSRFVPIVLCERAVKRRNLNSEIAESDYRSWIETGKVPCRPTPLSEKQESIRPRQSLSVEECNTNPKKRLWWKFWM